MTSPAPTCFVLQYGHCSASRLHRPSPAPNRFLRPPLRGEEWFKDMRLGVLVHTSSRVGHLQQDEASARHVCPGVSLQAYVSRLDAQLAAIRHCIARIDNQIQDYLLDLPGIRRYTIEVVVQLHRELDILFDQAPEHLLRIADGLVDVQDNRLNDLLAAKRQELARQRSGATCGLFDLFNLRAIEIR